MAPKAKLPTADKMRELFTHVEEAKLKTRGKDADWMSACEHLSAVVPFSRAFRLAHPDPVVKKEHSTKAPGTLGRLIGMRLKDWCMLLCKPDNATKLAQPSPAERQRIFETFQKFQPIISAFSEDVQDRITLYVTEVAKAREAFKAPELPAKPESPVVETQTTAKTGKRARESLSAPKADEPIETEQATKKAKRASTAREDSMSSVVQGTGPLRMESVVSIDSSVVTEGQTTPAPPPPPVEEDVKPGKDQLQQASTSRSTSRTSTPIKSNPTTPPVVRATGSIQVSTAERSTCPGDRTERRPRPERRVDRIAEPQPYGLSLYLDTISEEQLLPSARWQSIQHDFTMDPALERRVMDRSTIEPDTPFSQLPVQLSVELVRPAGAEMAHWSKSCGFAFNSRYWPVTFPNFAQVGSDPALRAQHSRVYNPEQIDLSELVRFKPASKRPGGPAVQRLLALQFADPVPDASLRIRTYTLFDAAWLRAQMVRNDPDGSRGNAVARTMAKALKRDPNVDGMSILDPLGSKGARVSIPIRSFKCDHLQPMDRETFIAAVSEGRHDWSCVLCGASARPTELYECPLLRIVFAQQDLPKSNG